MKVSVEISLYPLTDNYLNQIQAFIDRLHAYPSLSIRVDETATIVSGERSEVWKILEKETANSWDQEANQSVFVMKWFKGDLQNS
jgi:uncharacterized protein YqgV (UPF0045/DUF77 family)